MRVIIPSPANSGVGRAHAFTSVAVLLLFVLLFTGCGLLFGKEEHIGPFSSDEFVMHRVPGEKIDPQKWVLISARQTPDVEVRLTFVRASEVDRGPKWTELFEYQNAPRPIVSTKQFFARLGDEVVSECPTATFTLIKADRSDLMFQTKSGGCARFGDQDEIERFIFGKSNLFHLMYTARTRVMTPKQRDDAIRLLSSFRLGG
jgi:hypothetical protein